MRVNNNTARFAGFVQDLQESFGGDFQGRTREVLKRLLQTLLLVAYGIRRDGQRQLLAFTRAKSESQAGWEGLLNDLFQLGLRGHHLQLVITDGCAGLARALETVYLRARHQRCWVHKMRNILGKVNRPGRKTDQSGSAENLPRGQPS